MSEPRVLLYQAAMYRFLSISYYQEALKYGFKVMHICENPDYQGKMIYVYHMLGKIYLKMMEREKAVEIEERGIERMRKLADPWKIGFSPRLAHNEIGLTFFILGRYDEAISHYRESLKYSGEMNAHYLFIVRENIAEALIKAGRYWEARNLLDTMANSSGRYEHVRRNINYLLLEVEISLLNSDLGRCEAFLKNATTALERSSERKDPNMWFRLFDSKTQLLTLRNNQKALMTHLNRIQLYRDSLDLLQKKNIVAVRNTYYQKELENKDLILANSNLELANQESELMQEKLASRNRILWTFGIGLTLISILLGIAYGNLRRANIERQKAAEAERKKEQATAELGEAQTKKVELESALHNKDKDIRSLSHYLVGSNDQLAELKAMLSRVNRISDPAQKEQVMLEFISQARANIHIHEGKNAALKHMDRINEDFYAKLSQNHPNLTSGQKLLCGLIATGMNNTDIALEQNTTVNTVKTAKNRLKKRLDLAGESDLYTYLNSL